MWVSGGSHGASGSDPYRDRRSRASRVKGGRDEAAKQPVLHDRPRHAIDGCQNVFARLA
jgi:hypothetical protein